MPFHHFAFYVVDRMRPLRLIWRIATFEECLDEKKSFRKIVNAALVPAATAVLVVLLHKLLLPFVLVSTLYVLWAIYQSAKIAAPVCIHRVWNRTARMLEVSNLALLGAYIYVTAVTVDKLNPQFFVSIVLMVFVALNGFSMYAWLKPHRPRGVNIPKTEAQDESREYRRFLEDLADAWKMQDMCGDRLPHDNKLGALVCRGDLEAAEKVPENYPLIVVAYYLMFHKRDLETAQKVLNLVRSRNLDEKEKAALEILETARGAVEKPPCSEPEMLKQYVEKIYSVQTYGWASLLKALVVAHLTDDEDYRDDIRLAILWTVKNRHCDDMSACYFAYRILNRIRPLCRYPV